jgi:hypothetical protein
MQAHALAFTMMSFANIGWFGPGNFQECMLEKMKGQPPNMSTFVYKACNEQFPCGGADSKSFWKELNSCMEKSDYSDACGQIYVNKYCPDRFDLLQLFKKKN